MDPKKYGPELPDILVVTEAVLLGRGDGQGNGPAQEITVGDGLEWDGTTLQAVGGGAGITTEEARDAIGAILTDTATIDFTYTDDGTNPGTITADVKSASITLAMMANLAADTMIGSVAGGAPEAITVTAAGRALLDDAAASNQRTTLGLGGLAVLTTTATAQYDNDSVTFAKMQNLSANVLMGSAAGGDPEEITCTAAGRALLDDAAASNQRTTLGLGALAVESTVSTALVDDDAITYAKIQNVSAADRLLGRDTAGAGVIEEITASAALDFVGSTRGAVLYRGETAWAILAPGTSGHVLTSQGAGADPAYAEAPGAGSGAPEDATYVCISTNATLTNERTLAGESGVVSITDGGAGAAVTVGLTANGVALTKLATLAANTMIGSVAGGTPEAITVTAAGRALLDDAAASNQRTTLGLGALAVLSTVGTSQIDDAAVTNAKRAAVFYETVVALTDDVTIATYASLGNIFTVTLGGNRTLGAPSNPTNGQVIKYRIRQDGTGTRTLAYNAIFRFSDDVPSPTLSTAAGDTDYLAFIYTSADTKWDCLAVNKGFAA